MPNETRTAKQVDIMLLLEGTYPYVLGGVSSWVHQLIQTFPEYRFGAIFLGGQKKDYKGIQYKLPANLVHLENHYLFEDATKTLHSAYRKPSTNANAFETITEMHQLFSHMKQRNYKQVIQILLDHLASPNAMSLEGFLHSQLSWDYITHQFQEKCPHISFLDYFWSIRNMHLSLWKVIEIINKMPDIRCLHSVSTGYAGFLGALLSQKMNIPYLVSEHGIYIKERKIDLMQQQWFSPSYFTNAREQETKKYLTQLWIRFFELLGLFCYDTANTITSLFQAYQTQQIHYGAPRNKTRIINNGVDVNPDLLTGKKEPDHVAPVIAIIARVTPIKDIKNFIRACVPIFEAIPNASAWIVGSTHEDPAYFHECKNLVDILSLGNKIIFKGHQYTKTILKQVDVVVLSSISEGLPLVLLESFAAGVPVVATDVGACRELVEGATQDDRALGAAGLVVNISNAQSLSQAIITLLTDVERWQSCQKSALARVNTYYTNALFEKNYRSLYQEVLTPWLESVLS